MELVLMVYICSSVIPNIIYTLNYWIQKNDNYLVEITPVLGSILKTSGLLDCDSMLYNNAPFLPEKN